MEKEIKKWLGLLIKESFKFNPEDETEQVCELLGFIKSGQCFLDTIPNLSPTQSIGDEGGK